MPIPIKISLAAMRVNAKKTQDEIATEMHVTRNTVINWESGKTKIGEPQLTMFCNLCNFPKDNIFLP